MTERVGNPLGHYESRSLSDFNDRLLERLGGRWDRPPRLAPGWELDDRVGCLRSEAAERFATAFPADRDPVVWKDPRLSLLLPFWRTVIGDDLVGVLVVRSPLEVAGSLRARDGLRLSRGFALFQYYVRQALESFSGLPVYVCPFQELLDDPEGLVESFAAFLSSAGMAVPEPDRVALHRLVRPDLRHQYADVLLGDAGWSDGGLAADRADDADHEDDGETGAEDGFFALLESLFGPHERFRVPPLPAEPPYLAKALGRKYGLREQRARILRHVRQLFEPAAEVPVSEACHSK